MIKLYNKNCIDVLKDLKNKSIDFILIDPPYMQNFKTKIHNDFKNENVKGKFAKYKTFEDGFFKTKKLINDFFKLAHEKLKDNKNLMLFTGSKRIPDFIEIAKKNKFIYEDIIVWHKNNKHMVQYFTNCCKTNEYILLFRKSKQKLQPANNFIYDFYQIDNISGIKKNHPNAKPLELIDIFIKLYCKKGDVVFDGFMGGGVIGYVCKQNNINYIGCEIDNKFFEVADNMINNNIYLSYFKETKTIKRELPLFTYMGG